ncbi:HAD family hydrolase [Streptococcus bovimastitidis]|uniref:HAD family hydrolase n=1 Tax=Streptococcus bovimastitidis TaxID=1856638 RepID=A0A1L8MPT6_9STRE|nr:Cof-type HAD-IIB family hydrolase [Streptococcus bovimastitidis]OJF72780.1 HAD family hydrolase [Streptococcus bovimastitidis]
MIKLLASDMDGTFLDNQRSYDKERLAALLPKLKEKGMVFAVSSGRSLLAIDHLFEEFLDDIAVIAENGSIVQYQNRVIFADFMTKEQYIEIAQTILKNPFYVETGMLFSGQKGAYILEGASQDYIDRMHLYYENISVISDFDQMDHDSIFKITTTFTGDTVLEGSDWLDQQIPYVSAVTTGFESIDIILSEVNKGFGIEHLCQALDISPDQVIAFGDNLNDYQMLEYVGHAVATANARPEIKAIADEVIGDCNEQSVMTYMEGLV